MCGRKRKCGGVKRRRERTERRCRKGGERWRGRNEGAEESKGEDDRKGAM